MTEGELFQNLHKSELVKEFVNYLNRIKIEKILDPPTLDEKNVIGRKEAVKFIDEEIINKIILVNEKKAIEKNPFT